MMANDTVAKFKENRYRVSRWVTRIGFWMSKILKLDDFIFIIVNHEETTGYYSYKNKNKTYEICIDFDCVDGWTVCICNKWEEVLDEILVNSQLEAVRQANKFLRNVRQYIKN